jgi:hypothetical protein
MQRVGMKSNTFYRRIKEYEYSLEKSKFSYKGSLLFLIPPFRGDGQKHPIELTGAFVK